MKKILNILTIAIISLIITIGYAYAGTEKATIYVNVTVLPAVKYSILEQKNTITITQEDINKGYLDVKKAVTLSIKTNSTNGYLLLFSFNDTLLKELMVSDSGNTYRLYNSGGEIHMPYEGKNYVTKELNLRLYLLTDAQPGTYQLPVAIMASGI
jgi:hypothetical protein